jgi:phospholipid/cholesterol/gamma-HCH transport system substrate-binding protein
MNETRLAGKVGAFMILALVVLAGLLLTFSKGLNWFASSYTLRLRADNVGGLKPHSSVMVSGVPVGTVVGTELAPDGKGVTIFLKIHSRYGIHNDAEFVVEQIGLLGDQYVVVYPSRNQGPLLRDGDEVSCRAPFSLQALAVSAVGFIQRVDDTTKLLKDAVVRINNVFLTDATLTNLSYSVGNLRTVSERAITLVDHLNTLVSTNTSPITASLTNFVRFSDDLNRLATDLRQTVSENRTNISAAIRNLEDSSRAVGSLARELDEGKGLVGSLFKDEQLRANFSNTLIHVATVTSNLARYGLLYKPKQPKNDNAPRTRTPRDSQ